MCDSPKRKVADAAAAESFPGHLLSQRKVTLHRLQSPADIVGTSCNPPFPATAEIKQNK